MRRVLLIIVALSLLVGAGALTPPAAGAADWIAAVPEYESFAAAWVKNVQQ